MSTTTKDSQSKPVWVQKYGGTSVATPELIQRAAARIHKRRDEGHSMVVVVSAMGDTTDRLVSLAAQLSSNPPRRELDVLLSAGELQSMSLLCIALHERGVPAISFSGSQVGIRTDSRYSQARIRHIDGDRIRTELERGKVVVVAGFQGVTDDHDVTTLGRGGSDTSAVALAAALKAKQCEILTDVRGVYTADPRVVPNARQIAALSSDEMLELANLGAKVLHSRAVDLARRFQVPLCVAHSGEDVPGTIIDPLPQEQSNMDMEKVIVRGITQDASVQKISLVKVPDQPGVAAKVFGLLGEQGIPIRLIVQAQSHAGHNDITFIVSKDEALDEQLLNQAVQTVGGETYICDDQVGLLSIVGEGIARDPQLPATVFKVLAEESVNIDLISTSNLVLTCVVRESDLDRGARALHAALVESG